MDKGILDPEVQEFIRSHAGADPAEIALRKRNIAGMDISAVLDQMRSRNTASRKIPEWAAVEGIYWPASLAMEQCSSNETARFKQKFLQYGTVHDLTGGAGVDSYFFSEVARKVFYSELDKELCSIARHNFEVLGISNIEVLHGGASICLSGIEDAGLIYLDPSRRTGKGKVFLLEDCEPPLLELWEELKTRSAAQLVKLSPMLDISSIFRQLGHNIEITVLAVANEMKELLVYRHSASRDSAVHCVNITSEGKEEFSFQPLDEEFAVSRFSDPLRYIYEPNASILKAGAFKLTGTRFDLSKLAPNTHLYTSDSLRDDFPGRKFRVKGLHPVSKPPQLKKVNIAVRNFPMNAEALRKKLRIDPGGEEYLYGCTLNDNKKVLISMERMD